MRPNDAALDATNRGLFQTIIIGDGLLDITVAESAAYLLNVLSGDLRSTVLRTSENTLPATTLLHVSHILCLRTSAKMGRIATWTVITGVEHLGCWHHAIIVRECPRNPMSPCQLSPPTHPPIAAIILTEFPRPAIIRPFAIHVTPKPLRWITAS